MEKERMPRPSRGTTLETSAFCIDAVSAPPVAKKRAGGILQRATVVVEKYSVRVDRAVPRLENSASQASRSKRSERRPTGWKRKARRRHTHDSDEFVLFFFKLVCLRYDGTMGRRARPGSRTAPPETEKREKALQLLPTQAQSRNDRSRDVRAGLPSFARLLSIGQRQGPIQVTRPSSATLRRRPYQSTVREVSLAPR